MLLALSAFVLVSVTVARIVLSDDPGPPRKHPLSVVVQLTLWGLFAWVVGIRPILSSVRRMTTIKHLVAGRLVRIRAGLVTADVPGERHREWSLGRRARRMSLGDAVWLSPAVADDAPVIAVCLPAQGKPFVVTDAPGIYTSLR